MRDRKKRKGNYTKGNLSDDRREKEKSKTLELFVQTGGVDVGWMTVEEYDGEVHQKHLEEICDEWGTPMRTIVNRPSRSDTADLGSK